MLAPWALYSGCFCWLGGVGPGRSCPVISKVIFWHACGDVVITAYVMRHKGRLTTDGPSLHITVTRVKTWYTQPANWLLICSSLPRLNMMNPLRLVNLATSHIVVVRPICRVHKGSQKGGYILVTLYSFMQRGVMQSLHPVASPAAYASRNLSVIVEFLFGCLESVRKRFFQFNVWTKGGFGQPPSTPLCMGMVARFVRNFIFSNFVIVG